MKAQRDPAGAYITVLKRMPLIEETNNGSPRYSVPQHLIDWDGFAADIAPLRQAFDDALPSLTSDQKRALRQDVGALLGIDVERLKQQQERYERQEYFPANLPADYLQLRFEVAGQSGGLSHARQLVSDTFWFGLRALLHYKQIEASSAFEKLNAALGEMLPIPVAGSSAYAPQPLNVCNKNSCYCRTHPNTETLADLPANCRIHETIRGALLEIEKQVAARKLADSPAGFKSYCEGELDRHAKNVGDMAKNLAHPTLYSEAVRPKMIEAKLWNLTLCGLYKNELAALVNADKPVQLQDIAPLKTPRPSVATPAEIWVGLLRPKVCFTLSDLDQLLVKVGLLNDTTSLMPTPDFKGSALLGVLAALRERRYLLLNDNAKLARLLAERYGPDAANPNTIARGTNTLPGAARPIHTRTLALLSAP